MEDLLLNPLEGYKKVYKETHKKNTVEYFEELVKKSKINIEENKNTVKEYKTVLEKLDKIKSKINQLKVLKFFLIIIIILSIITAIVLGILSFSKHAIEMYIAIIAIILSILITVGFIALINLTINKKISINIEIKNNLEITAKQLLDLAWSQMAGLNSLFDWGMAGEIISKTIPLIQMDKYFDEKKFAFLHEKYGLSESKPSNVSTYFCQSGSIQGNPFIINKDYEQHFENKCYTGSLTIHWTQTVRENNHTRVIHRTQTLHAHVYREAPTYNFNTYLIYGNEAAPKLEFSRKPVVKPNMDNGDINKLVKKGAEKLDKKARKAITTGTNYTRFGNDEFEVLFGGSDRNNEVEYRLLFTPLAQKNMINLIKSKEPFGDDFFFKKKEKLNYVTSNHSQTADYYGSPSKFVHYDFEACKKTFIDYNVSYFKNLYFDLAPLLNIPLYQQQKPKEFIYDKEYKSNISSYEHEAMANSMDIQMLKPNDACTPSILKTDFIRKNGEIDSVLVTAHAFRAERRVTFVPTLGGDGKTHNVPVYWLEYFPVTKQSLMAVEPKNISHQDFRKFGPSFNKQIKDIIKNNSCIYERGLIAFLLLREMNIADANSINSALKNVSLDPIYKTAEAINIAESVQEELNKYNKEISIEKELENTNQDSMLNDENAETTEIDYKNVNVTNVEDKPSDDDDDDI